MVLFVTLMGTKIPTSVKIKEQCDDGTMSIDALVISFDTVRFDGWLFPLYNYTVKVPYFVRFRNTLTYLLIRFMAHV